MNQNFKLNLKRTILVGLAFMTISSFWQLYDFYIPLILKNQFQISDLISGVVMAMDNVIALFLLPILGSISDKVKSPYGRRMPFIVLGTAATVILMILIPFAAEQRNLILFGVFLLLILLAIASYRTPAVSLMPDVTIKPLRSQGNAIINLMGALGGVLVLGLMRFISYDKMHSYYPIFFAVALLMVIGVVLMIVFVHEVKWSKEAMTITEEYQLDTVVVESESHDVAKAVRRSLYFILLSIALWFMGYNAVTTAFSRYATILLGFSEGQASQILLVANISAIIAFVPIGMVSARIGRKRSIFIGIVCLCVSFLTATFYQSYSPLMIVNFAFAGFGWAAINVNSLPMVLEMAQGSEVGKYTGFYYSFSMSAQIITPILSGFLFTYAGFGYRILFPYATFFIALALVTMSQVKHGDAVKIAKE